MKQHNTWVGSTRVQFEQVQDKIKLSLRQRTAIQRCKERSTNLLLMKCTILSNRG